MSLARLALRLATVEALRPTSSLAIDGPWPTLAGRYVFDSRIDPLDDKDPAERQPMVCVYTDHDEGKAGQARGGPPFFDTVDLCFEISTVVRVPAVEDASVFELAYPETDAELEAGLDFLEAQIRFTLLFGGGAPGDVWRKISGRRVHTPSSAPQRSGEEGVKLAKREMKWKVEIHDDCWDPAPAVQPSGNAVLPHTLQFLAAHLASTSYGASIIAAIAGAPSAPVMPVAVPLKTVGLNISVEGPGGALPASPNIIGEVDNLDQ